jgi:hypothetical protein
MVIHGCKHYQVRIKAGTPANARTWQGIGVLPEGKVGTITGEMHHMAGLEGFLRVMWDGYPKVPALVNPAHVERLQEATA